MHRVHLCDRLPVPRHLHREFFYGQTEARAFALALSVVGFEVLRVQAGVSAQLVAKTTR